MFKTSILYISASIQTYTVDAETYKMDVGCFNPTLGQIWTNPNIGLKPKHWFKNVTQL